MEVALHVIYDAIEPLTRIGVVPGWIGTVVLVLLGLAVVRALLER